MREHKDTFLKTGDTVPRGGVNLAYYITRPLNSDENIQISNYIGSDVNDGLYVKIGRDWQPRITASSIEKISYNMSTPEKLIYGVPEYNRQEFDPVYGVGYIRVEEAGVITGRNTIQLSNRNLVVTWSSDHSRIVSINVSVNYKEAVVIDYNEENLNSISEITVTTVLNIGDVVVVNYVYEEPSYIYKGYTDSFGRFIRLDLNPTDGHYYDYVDSDNMIKTEPTLWLLNKTVYIYDTPSQIHISSGSVHDEEKVIPTSPANPLTIALDNSIRYGSQVSVKTKYSNMTIEHRNNLDTSPDKCVWDYGAIVGEEVSTLLIYNADDLSGESLLIDYYKYTQEYVLLWENINSTLSHSVIKFTPQQLMEKRAILVAEINIRSNCSIDNIRIIDTRARGGGLLPMTEEEAYKLNRETRYYMDINDINGELLQENSVIILKFSKDILQQNGGRFTQMDIENAVKEFIGYGTLPIIQFVEPTEHNVLR